MAGKKKPPRPLGEARPLKASGSAKRPAGGATKPDEHLRDRLDAALAAAIVGARERDVGPPAASPGNPDDLRTRLQAALEPPALEPAPPEPIPREPISPEPGPPPRARVVLLVAGLLVIGSIGVILIRSVGREPVVPARLSTTSAQPAAPVPVRTGSSYAATTVRPDGSVSVSHWVRPRTRANELTLSLPEVPAGGSMGATDVRVAVDGTAIPGPGSIDTGPYTYVLAGGSEIFVTYHLTGAVERSPSVDGRALVRVTSLDLSVEDVQTRTQAVNGVEVLSLACTAVAERAIPEPCGEMVGDRWEVRLTGPDLNDRVMAQVDLG